MQKIGLLGTTATISEAPFDDESWDLWAFSPGNTDPNACRRWDQWFEIHNLEHNLVHAPEVFPEAYLNFLRTDHGKPKHIPAPVPEWIPGAVDFDWPALVAEFGDKFFTSSVAWVAAYAITLKPEVIGLWGVDMGAGGFNANGEASDERPGVWHFIEAAESRGIEIVMPETCKLRARPRLYGIEVPSPIERALRKRLADLQNNLAEREQLLENAKMNVKLIEGSIVTLQDLIRCEYG